MSIDTSGAGDVFLPEAGAAFMRAAWDVMPRLTSQDDVWVTFRPPDGQGAVS